MAPQAASNMNQPQQAKPGVDAPASVSNNNSMSMYRLELKHEKSC